MNKVLINRTLINLDTGLVIRWERSELGYNAAVLSSPLATGDEAERSAYQLDYETSNVLWGCMTYETTRQALGVLLVGGAQ
jgi:hypothetical protein